MFAQFSFATKAIITTFTNHFDCGPVSFKIQQKLPKHFKKKVTEILQQKQI